MAKVRIDVLLSCGHVKIIDITNGREVLLGDVEICERCNMVTNIVDIGYAYYDEDDRIMDAG